MGFQKVRTRDKIANLNTWFNNQLPAFIEGSDAKSLDEIDSVVKCVELGAEDYLNKPVNPVLLRARVNASLEKKQLRDQQRKLFRTFATPEVAEELLQKLITESTWHKETLEKLLKTL